MRALEVAVTCPWKVLEKGQNYIAQGCSSVQNWLPMVYHSDEGWCERGPWKSHLAVEFTEALCLGTSFKRSKVTIEVVSPVFSAHVYPLACLP